MGDLNGVTSLEVDRTIHETESKEGRLPLTFLQLVENLKLQDAWRVKHRNEKQVTHHSEAKNSLGRIDAIWVSKSLLLKIRKVEIYSKTVLDHNPTTLEIREGRKITRRWRINESILNNEKILEKAKATLREYFENNLNQETDLKIVWDASKVVI